MRKEIIGDCTLYLGDCRELMAEMEGGSVDCVVTDPPYDQKTHDGAVLDGAGIDFEPLSSIPELCFSFLRVSRRWVVVFCSLEMIGLYAQAHPKSWVRGGLWDRVVNMPQISGDRPAQGGEGVAVLHNPGVKRWNGGGKAGLWRCAVERGGKRHPTQKPIRLIKQLISDFTDPMEVIFDPFAGSGTTGVACVEFGRKFIGCEIDERYFDMACKRIDMAERQGRLF